MSTFGVARSYTSVHWLHPAVIVAVVTLTLLGSTGCEQAVSQADPAAMYTSSGAAGNGSGGTPDPGKPEPVKPVSECDDGLFCNGQEAVDEVTGVCLPGTAPVLDDGVACTEDLCDEQLDSIVHVADHSLCDNGLFCDGAEFCDPINDCQPGIAPVIDDGVGCTDDSCDDVNNVVVNAPNNSLCDNGVFCDGAEICSPTQDCQAVPDEPDGTPCGAGEECYGGICGDPCYPVLNWSQQGAIKYRTPEVADFFAKMDSCYYSVDFDDISAPGATPVAFQPDRYEASLGIIINGSDSVGGTGQYVSGNSFGYPGDFPPTSPTNVFAPGPVATSSVFGEKRLTEITFAVNGVPAGVTGFSAYFIDADFWAVGEAIIRAYDDNGDYIDGFAVYGANGTQEFGGLVAVDGNGTPIPAIYKIELVSGNCWPTLGGCEGVVLDDFVFGFPKVIP